MAVGEFLAIPGLRGLWIGSINTSGGVYDLSGNGHTLSYNGNPTWNYTSQGAPYLDLDGTGDYLSIADTAGLDILGTESYVASAVRGLTIGGWFWADDFSTIPCLINKYTVTGNQKSYLIQYTSGGAIQFVVSSTGANDFAVSTVATVSTGTWNFCVGRYIPSTEITAFVNTNSTDNSTSIPASIFNSTASIEIGRLSGTNSNLLNGRAAFAFVSACSLSDTHISNLYEASRSLFGV